MNEIIEIHEKGVVAATPFSFGYVSFSFYRSNKK